MNTTLVDRIVNAVLYEGYMLYPYRPSAIKNRQRFNFGVVHPRAYSEAGGETDPWIMQTECLVVGSRDSQCTVKVRFLRMITRSIEKVLTPTPEPSSVGDTESVDRLEVDGKVLFAWQEAAEEEITVTEFNLSALAAQSMQWPFCLSARTENEPVRDARGLIVAIMKRGRAKIGGKIEFAAQELSPGLFRLTARISNTSNVQDVFNVTREQALSQSLVSAHTILEVRGGEFVSLVDPPASCREAAQACQNIGTWPILVGEEGQRNTMLSSPIILYDYPLIAPESPGDLFDGAEIDEILSLRIMTMTEEEKREMRESDERTRHILERTENLPDEQLMKLHGVLRGLRNAGGEMP